MANGLIDIVNRLRGKRAIVVGDFMLDRYLYGTADRLSPEAPVPVLHFQREETRLGGAGHVAADLATLGVEVTAVGVAGDDDFGKRMAATLAEEGVTTTGLTTIHGRPTTSKVRLVGMAQHRTPQQMIRLDYEDSGDLDAEACSVVTKAVAQALTTGTDVVCIEDYNKGVCCDDVIREVVRACREANVPVLVDPPKVETLSKYKGVTCIKLNRREAQAATGIDCDEQPGVAEAAKQLLADLDLEAVIITIDKDGAYLATREGESRLLETRARSVADVTGAGDMFLAMLAAARAAGGGWADATALANVASGLEVERFGAQPVTPQEIVSELVNDLRHDRGKIWKADELAGELDHHRAAGRHIVFTNGCFDIVHLGHVEYFRYAKAQGDLLVVGINTDESIRRLKGDKRPIIGLDDRLGVLAELESIDYLVTFDDDTPLSLIEAVQPDVLVKGADYEKEQVVGWDRVEARGGRVALAPLVEGRSTSTVIQKIIEAYGE
jgi:D-beta-D-heptose 7-phosphate kinase/D-beta-D-heptose 1-phosphate adenosyltransferase